MHEIAQLMGQGSQAFIQRPVGFRLRCGIFLVRVFRNGVGDAVVETAIEGPKLIYSDRDAAFESQIRYRLTQITVVVDELVKEQRDTVGNLSVSHLAGIPLGNLEPAPVDQVSPVSGEEFV